MAKFIYLFFGIAWGVESIARLIYGEDLVEDQILLFIFISLLHFALYIDTDIIEKLSGNKKESK